MMRAFIATGRDMPWPLNIAVATAADIEWVTREFLATRVIGVKAKSTLEFFRYAKG